VSNLVFFFRVGNVPDSTCAKFEAKLNVMKMNVTTLRDSIDNANLSFLYYIDLIDVIQLGGMAVWTKLNNLKLKMGRELFLS
jgi:hypothetical protein